MGSGRVHTGSSDHLGAFGLARAALASSSRVIESPSHVMPADTQTAANHGPRSSIHTAGRVERPSQVLFIMGRDCCLPGRGRGRLESKLADAPSSRAHGSVPSSSSLLPTERRIPCSLFIPDAVTLMACIHRSNLVPMASQQPQDPGQRDRDTALFLLLIPQLHAYCNFPAANL